MCHENVPARGRTIFRVCARLWPRQSEGGLEIQDTTPPQCILSVDKSTPPRIAYSTPTRQYLLGHAGSGEPIARFILYR